MNITDLKNEKQERYSSLMKDCLIFFAFSTEQFNEGKTPLKEGEKYVSIGHGGYMPKGQTENWLTGCTQIEKWYKAEVKKSKNQDEEILYELRNCECFYVGDPSDVYDRLPYSKEKINAVYRKHYAEEVEKVC
jgi:hypothetical protein